MSNSNVNPKSKVDLICDQLMGLEVTDDDNDYGTICRIDIVNENGCEWYKVYTNLGHTFNAGVILQALSLANLYQEAEDNADRDDNVTVLPVGFPDGTRYSNSVFGPRRKRITQVISSQAISNKACVGDNEYIDITSHVSSSSSFPEENKRIDQILTPEELEIYINKTNESVGK